MLQTPASRLRGILGWLRFSVLRKCVVCTVLHGLTERGFTRPNGTLLAQVSTKTTVVNFSVKQLGLEAQLLGIVVQREQPSLEEQSSELTVKVLATLVRSVV